MSKQLCEHWGEKFQPDAVGTQDCPWCEIERLHGELRTWIGLCDKADTALAQGEKALAAIAADNLRLRAVFEEARNEVRMCHNTPCYCKYCFQEPKP